MRKRHQHVLGLDQRRERVACSHLVPRELTKKAKQMRAIESFALSPKEQRPDSSSESFPRRPKGLVQFTLAKVFVLVSPSKAGSVNLVTRFATHGATMNTKPINSKRGSVLSR